MCSPTQKLSEPCPFWLLMEASLQRHDWLTHWPLVIIQPPALPLSTEDGGGSDSSKPLNHVVGSPGNQPHPLVLSKSHLINITRDNFAVIPIFQRRKLRVGSLSHSPERIKVGYEPSCLAPSLGSFPSQRLMWNKPFSKGCSPISKNITTNEMLLYLSGNDFFFLC